MPRPHDPLRVTTAGGKADARGAASDRLQSLLCVVCKKEHSVRMRKAESARPDFHLLEELAKPRACVNGHRVTVWIYRDGPFIREIVLSGHTEGRTCSSVSSAIIEAASQLDDQVKWMITPGAAYFRLMQEETEQEDDLARSIFNAVMGGQPDNQRQFDNRAKWLPSFASSSGWKTQAILGDMIRRLSEISTDTGIVEIVEQNWDSLDRFRKDYNERAGSGLGQIVLPDPNSAGVVADFLPIVPSNDPAGKPLVFKFEGWDFDCPEYQMVADIHLHRVRRELLRDARSRRMRYRGWLKEWVEDWAPRLHALPQEQADEIVLNVPLPNDETISKTASVSASDFLKSHAATFLDKGQDWYKTLAAYYKHMPFDQLSDEELDEPIHPDQIKVINFEEVSETIRQATEDDKPFTLRERLMINDPNLISQCLLWIRRMDLIIKPYEEWEKQDVKGRAPGKEDPKQRKRRMTEEISRQIVIETMVRGWPSFYLEDKEDRKVFAAWADKYRMHAWAVIAQQCRKAGVALDLLLENNVVYDVRFNDDLGCTLQPLMLADDAAHAQLHCTRAGASAVVPVWDRSQSNLATDQTLQLGANNRQRAANLVDEARLAATGPQGDAARAAALLRMALACHPAEAGMLILQEWKLRIARSTSEEFRMARSIVGAKELALKNRYGEAKVKLKKYLTSEPNPVQDAYVILAVSALLRSENSLVEQDESVNKYNRLLDEYNALTSSVESGLGLPELNGQVGMKILESVKMKGKDFENLSRLRSLTEELTRLGRKIKDAKSALEEERKKRRQLIEKALSNPLSAFIDHPHLSVAADKARDELAAVLDRGCLYYPSTWMTIRYGGIAKIIEVRALLDIYFDLVSLHSRLSNDPNKAQQQIADEMKRLSQSVWAPEAIISDLKSLAEGFGKGELDSLRVGWTKNAIIEAVTSFHFKIADLLSDWIVFRSAMREPITTHIHLLHILDGKYKRAFDALIDIKIPFGISTSKAWKVLDRETGTIPEGATLSFDANTCSVLLNTETNRIPLIQSDLMTPGEQSYVASIISAPDLILRINRFAPCVAEGLLAVDIEPRPDWQLWRDAMRTIEKEMLVALSEFGDEACLMPKKSVPVREIADDFEQRLNQQIPRQAPSIDWSWAEPDNWRDFIDADVKRMCAGETA